MLKVFFEKLNKARKKPLGYVIYRLKFEIDLILSQFTDPIMLRFFSNKVFLKKNYSKGINDLWFKLGENKFFCNTDKFSKNFYEKNFADSYKKIFINAENGLNNNISLLGTGLIDLGKKIDWHKDYKSGIRWDSKHISKIIYSNPDDFSDVKIPWEISRKQWLIPLAQAYHLTSDEKYALKVKNVLLDWISENPYAQSVNWACTMEAAIRIFTWTWFFHIFKNSHSWKDEKFRFKFLKYLWLHGKFTDEHIEKSDINGNHFTADASALVIVGLFFKNGKSAKRWSEIGWKYLENELPKQVYNDGVDFEGSVPYHRLVFELFLFPAIYRKKMNLNVSKDYVKILHKMIEFTISYTKPNGTCPVWGDADDARALPFNFDNINDHRYLISLFSLSFEKKNLINFFDGSLVEPIWFFGEDCKEKLVIHKKIYPISKSFNDSGIYIMSDNSNHIFIDCGPVGYAGRGGHGHNDILSFEAFLDGKNLIVDSGSYLYTADFYERNKFRSSGYHNTPIINNEEINRYVRWDHLWNLKNDALPKLIKWDTSKDNSVFIGSHTGYKRLKPSLSPVRSINLDHVNNNLFVHDKFIGNGIYPIEIPFHFHPDVEVNILDKKTWTCIIHGKKYFFKDFSENNWNSKIENSRVSFSYGKFINSKKVTFKINQELEPSLKVAILTEKKYISDKSYIHKHF